MGFFDSIGDWFKGAGQTIAKPFKRAVKGIKSGVGKAIKGIKNTFDDKFVKGFKKGFGMVGKALQEPAKWIKKNDPLAPLMGDASFLSPISLVADIGLAPVTGVGYLEQLAVDDKLQKKLKSGDADTIMDTAFSGLSLIPMGSISKLGKGIAKGGRALSKAIRGGSKLSRFA